MRTLNSFCSCWICFTTSSKNHYNSNNRSSVNTPPQCWLSTSLRFIPSRSRSRSRSHSIFITVLFSALIWLGYVRVRETSPPGIRTAQQPATHRWRCVARVVAASHSSAKHTHSAYATASTATHAHYLVLSIYIYLSHEWVQTSVWHQQQLQSHIVRTSLGGQ